MDLLMHRVMFWFVNCAFFCLCGNTAVYANNQLLQPILDPAIHIEQQEIKHFNDQTIITNVIINTSNNSIAQIFLTTANTQIAANNTNVEVLNNQTAISEEGLDVSRILKNLGVPLDPITAMHVIDSSPNRDHLRSKLIALKLLDKDQEAPLWTVKSYNYWRATFPAQSSTTITQIYKQQIQDKHIKQTENNKLLSTPWSALKKIYNAACFWRATDLQDKPAVIDAS